MFLSSRLTILSCTVFLLASTASAQPAAPPGGAGPRLDGSSEAAHKASVERAKRAMSPADRARLDKSLALARRLFGEGFLQRVHGVPVQGASQLHEMVLKQVDSNGDGEIDDREVAAARDEIAGARRHANELAAIATMRSLVSAQEQTRAMGMVDVDGNGQGEYAFIGEMTAVIGVRTGAGKPGRERISPPLLSRQFWVNRGLVERSGYMFKLWLPNAQGRAVAEGQRGGVGQFPPDPAHAERAWCAYAWPADADSGHRAFFVNQDGEVLETDNETQHYNGRGRPPSPYSAFPLGVEKVGSLPDRVDARNDRGTWRQVR